MKSFALKASLLALFGAMASGQAFAHATYNITGAGLTLNDSVNNTDGISNTGGYSQNGGTVGPNSWIPGTGALPADVLGTLPFNWYSGQHNYADTAVQTRDQHTGTSNTDANSLWKAAYTDANNAWAPYAPATTTTAHPYLAVGGESFDTTAGTGTGGGLDYGLIHAAAGANNVADNSTSHGNMKINFTITQDAANSSTGTGLLDVFLYRGTDTSLSSNRTALFDPLAVGVQGSSLGTGGADGFALLWQAHQTLSSDTLTYSLFIDPTEWAKTDALNGTTNDGSAGYYTLIVAAHGGGAGSGVAYEVVTASVSAVPIPAAVWLFGSALGGMGVFGRRKPKTTAAMA